MKQLNTIGVIGAGTMGSALAQKFAQEGFKVILSDRTKEFVENGLKRINNTLNEGVEKRIFSEEKKNEILNNIKTSYNLNDLKSCDLIVEAIFENFEAKAELFKSLSNFVTNDCIVATNTSSFSVTELSKYFKKPSNFIGLHYFYHAAKNRLVEIIPGKHTSEETFKIAKKFAALTGKDPIITKDTYGFAVNRFFVPWLNEAVKILEEGIANEGEIDAISKYVFQIDMGPFALMNATGIPVAYHAEKTLEVFGNVYKVANALIKQVEKGENWNITNIEYKTIDEKKIEKVRDRLLGIVFFVCLEILNEKVCSATELNRGARIGLKWKKGPIEIMKEKGKNNVYNLVEKIAKKYNTTPPQVNDEFPRILKMNYVFYEKNKDKGIIKIVKPEDMNALNEEIIQELNEKIERANNDNINTLIITGSGKAFVAGADIKFFIQNIKSGTIDNIEKFTSFGQKVFDSIDNSPKKTIALLNGLALGGGAELALCADYIIACPKSQIAFPETSIGIYPGLGGTQRLAKRVGKGMAKYLIFTGKMLNANEAFEIGLVDAIIPMSKIFDILENEEMPQSLKNKELPDKWKDIAMFFENNSLDKILSGNYDKGFLKQEKADEIIKTIKQKAPLALRYAEKLIDEAKGVKSELCFLKDIFSSEDALLGLSNIGKKVEFKGKMYERKEN